MPNNIALMNEENKIYEISFLAKTENGRSEVEQALNKYQAPIIDNGQVSRIKLAYPINKESFAYFGYIIFSGNPENIKKIGDEFKNNPQILRFLIISSPVFRKKTTEAETVPQITPFHRKELDIKPASPQPIKRIQQVEELSNEALEKKLEEILK